MGCTPSASHRIGPSQCITASLVVASRHPNRSRWSELFRRLLCVRVVTSSSDVTQKDQIAIRKLVSGCVQLASNPSKQNISVRLETVRKGRILAARRSTSICGLLAEEIENRSEPKRLGIARSPQPSPCLTEAFIWCRITTTRDELHETLGLSWIRNRVLARGRFPNPSSWCAGVLCLQLKKQQRLRSEKFEGLDGDMSRGQWIQFITMRENGMFNVARLNRDLRVIAMRIA
jgi:hypothetical protein